MNRLLRIAIFGAGRMARQHAAAIRLQKETKLVAVADTFVGPDEIKQHFGADVEAYDDPRTLLAQCKPDVVHIVTPPLTHVDLARACLENGAHAYVEKPFAPGTAEAEELLGLADRKGLKLCAAHQVLFQRAGQRYRDYLPVIGEVVHVESYFSFKPVRRRADGGAPLSAVDQLVDILPHPVYLMLSALDGHEHDEPALTALDVAPNGEVRAIVRSGEALATLTVTLRGRPVESYLRIVGKNGSLEADFVLGGVTKLLGPGASAPAVVMKPFSQAIQVAGGSFAGLLRLVFKRHKSYPGLAELLELFYTSVRTGSAPPVDRSMILNTVRICEKIAQQLAVAEKLENDAALQQLAARTEQHPPTDQARGVTLVTGGTGFLGRAVLEELRNSGLALRAPCRRIPAPSQQLPGVEYVEADLAKDVAVTLMKDVTTVVHLAAETAGDKSAHERNTVDATKKLLDAMEAANVRRLINIGSVAVLRPGRAGETLREDSHLDRDNLARGPYVWAKAEAEAIALERAEAIDVRTLRLGPLVNLDDFTAPGRLGREVARLFVAVGSRSARLSVCDVHTAAVVIRRYVHDFESTPPCVNLLEVPALTRGELVDRLRAVRPDLRVVWLPFAVLRVLSKLAILLQRIKDSKRPPLDLYAAFKSESYDPALARGVIEEAQTGPREPLPPEALPAEELRAARG